MRSYNRQELLAWVNNLLQLNITKVEQCGTGYADQVFISILLSRLWCRLSFRADAPVGYAALLSTNANSEAVLDEIYSGALCQIYDSIFCTDESKYLD